jgi:hypothetical protein
LVINLNLNRKIKQWKINPHSKSKINTNVYIGYLKISYSHLRELRLIMMKINALKISQIEKKEIKFETMP